MNYIAESQFSNDADSVEMEKYLLASLMEPYSLHSECMCNNTQKGSVQSFSSFGKTYDVSLVDQTCSCPDFVESRSNFAINYFSRWCKHVIAFASETGAFDDCSVWHKAIACEGKGGPFAAFLISQPNGQQFLTAIGSNREWINVFVKTARQGEKLPLLTGPVRQFGWSIGEKRWSYGIAPRGAGSIQKLLVQIEGINEE